MQPTCSKIGPILKLPIVGIRNGHTNVGQHAQHRPSLGFRVDWTAFDPLRSNARMFETGCVIISKRQGSDNQLFCVKASVFSIRNSPAFFRPHVWSVVLPHTCFRPCFRQLLGMQLDPSLFGPTRTLSIFGDSARAEIRVRSIWAGCANKGILNQCWPMWPHIDPAWEISNELDRFRPISQIGRRWFAPVGTPN